MWHKNRGFTLLELMVTIIIMSILLAVSGPIYISYTVKSRFAEVFGTINQYKDDLQTAYVDNGQFPTTVGGMTANTYVPITSNVIQQVYYNVASGNQAAYVQFFTLDLGVNDYVAADSSGADGVNCRVTLAAVLTNTGNTRFYCGQWDGSATDVPLKNLPQGCQDTAISALF